MRTGSKTPIKFGCACERVAFMVFVYVLNMISGRLLCELAVDEDTVGLELKSQISIEIGAPLSQLILSWGATLVENRTRLCDLLRPGEEAIEFSLVDIARPPVDEDVVLDENAMTESCWMGAKVNAVIDGVRFSGQVDKVERGVMSSETLYLIQYSDGDLEHWVEDDVLRCLDRDEAEKQQLWKRFGMTSERFWRVVEGSKGEKKKVTSIDP